MLIIRNTCMLNTASSNLRFWNLPWKPQKLINLCKQGGIKNRTTPTHPIIFFLRVASCLISSTASRNKNWNEVIWKSSCQFPALLASNRVIKESIKLQVHTTLPRGVPIKPQVSLSLVKTPIFFLQKFWLNDKVKWN